MAHEVFVFDQTQRCTVLQSVYFETVLVQAKTCEEKNLSSDVCSADLNRQFNMFLNPCREVKRVKTKQNTNFGHKWILQVWRQFFFSCASDSEAQRVLSPVSSSQLHRGRSLDRTLMFGAVVIHKAELPLFPRETLVRVHPCHYAQHIHVALSWRGSGGLHRKCWRHFRVVCVFTAHKHMLGVFRQSLQPSSRVGFLDAVFHAIARASEQCANQKILLLTPN